MSDTISRRDVAALIGVSTDTLGIWARKTGHSFPKPVSRAPALYDRQAVEAWADACRKNPPADKRVARVGGLAR